MKKNLFGTDGIRTRIGTHPFTIDALPELGKALGSWIIEKYGRNAQILIAHDTRQSSAWVISALQTGLLTYPVTIVNADVLPTPVAFQAITQHKKYQCGIVISASHNPYHDNGIKIIDAAFGKISEADELRITDLFYAHAPLSYDSFGNVLNTNSIQEQYIERALSFFEPQFLKYKKIVLDCAHGATSYIAPFIFKKTGAQVVTINNQPQGTNINDGCGALHTEPLRQAVLNHNADIGFAFDGDGDRVIAVNNNGIIKDGDDLLALLATHPRYSASTTIVGTVMTNQGFEEHLKKHGKTLLRTSVGDKYITENLLSYKLSLGGEPSGHIILTDYLPTGDGIFAALRIAQTAQYTNNWALETFTKFPQVLMNVTVSQKKDLTASPLAEIISATQMKLGNGRILVRYSGTEPLLRIMAEAHDYAVAHDAVTSLCQQLVNLL
jgi:phosphoglucosamine mutase